MPEEQDSFVRKKRVEKEDNRVRIRSIRMEMGVERRWKGLGVL